MAEMYGEKGGRFPVQRGDVWQVGRHLVACGDLEYGDGASFLAYAQTLRGKSPTLFYCDPPWSQAYITKFRKGAAAVLRKEYTVESVCKTIMRLTNGVPLLMEMGTTYPVEKVQDWAFDTRVFKDLFTFDVPITYGGGKPAVLIAFNLPQQQGLKLRELGGLDDDKTPQAALELYTNPGDVVVDLCLGLGATARGAQRCRPARECWGMELHPRRCSAALCDLEKLCGAAPLRIGEM